MYLSFSSDSDLDISTGGCAESCSEDEEHTTAAARWIPAAQLQQRIDSASVGTAGVRTSSVVAEAALQSLQQSGFDWLSPLLLRDGAQAVVYDDLLSGSEASAVAAAARSVAVRRAKTRMRPLQPRIRGDRVGYLRAVSNGDGTEGLGACQRPECCIICTD